MVHIFHKMSISYVTVQIVTVPQGVGLQVQADPETAGRQTAVFAVCVHAFVTVKPERLNCYHFLYLEKYTLSYIFVNKKI